MTKFSEKEKAQSLAALRKRIEHVEQLVSALVADVAVMKERLDALEVVRVPSPTVDPGEARRHDVAGTTFEAQMDLDEPQRPETE